MPSEKEILQIIKTMLPKSKKHLSDDAAILSFGKKQLVFTTDTIVEDTHFRLKTYKPEEIGWKALAINLSDIAAMGGNPLYALVSISTPKNISTTWIKNLYSGINNCAKKYKTGIIGGNLTKSKQISISITLIGELVKNKAGLRTNAKPNDVVFATGRFGESAEGLLLLSKNKAPWNKKAIERKLINKHKKPIPRIKEGQNIISSSNRVALMDASDGLADCLIQIAKESKVRIEVAENKIPKHKNTPLERALYGGEDYELVGTCSEKDARSINGINIIGRVYKGSGAYIELEKGRKLKFKEEKVFKHFKRNS